MRIVTVKTFDKSYAKLSFDIKEKFKERRNIFLIDKYNPQLNNHALTGEYLGYRSINITGDQRVLYYELDSTTIVFTHIGTHSQLFGK